MQFRSSNSKFTHHQGDVLSNVDDSSHGVHLTGGSTGGIVTACGDETNIGLTVRPKAAGPLVLGGVGAVTLGGTSTSALTIGGGTGALTVGGSGVITVGTSGSIVQFGGSTAPFAGMVRYLDTGVATPNFATTNAMVMETTHTLTGVSSLTAGANGFHILANGQNLSTDCALVGCYIGSTADQVHCRFAKVSTLTVAASTATVSFLVFRF